MNQGTGSWHLMLSAVSNPQVSPELLIGEADFVRSLARRLLADPAAAEDVAQVALLNTLERPPNVASVRFWLIRLVRNLVGQHRRHEERRRRREHLAAQTEQIPSTAEVIEREAIRSEIVRAVLELDDIYRTTILLRYFGGKSAPEAATILAVPLDTVRTREKRALQRLRSKLERRFKGSPALGVALANLVRSPRLSPFEGIKSLSLLRQQGCIAMTATSKALGAGLILVATTLCGVLFLLERNRPKEEEARRPVSDAAPPAVTYGRSASLREPLDGPEENPLPAAPALEAVVEPAVDASVSTGDLLVRVAWSDQSPAQNVVVRIPDFMHNGIGALASVTDAAGLCTFTAVHPGRIQVTVDRAEFPQFVTLHAGQQAEVDVVLRDGVDVDGVVVDARDIPVANAEIWISTPTGDGFQIAETTLDGTFALRSCVPNRMIWARAEGYAPSLCRPLPSEKRVSVTLSLQGGGAAVSGVVRDPDGSPVGAALVIIDGRDMRRREKMRLPSGEEIIQLNPGPTTTRTDENGRFSIAGLTPGTIPIGVVASRHAPWRGAIDCDAGKSATMQIQLEAGFTLRGTLKDAAGHPVAGRVFALTSCLQLSPTVWSEGDGLFEITGLPPGRVQLVAEAPSGVAAEDLTGARGEELTWDPTLRPGPTPMTEEPRPWGR